MNLKRIPRRSIPPLVLLLVALVPFAGCNRSQPSEPPEPPPAIDAGIPHMTMAEALASAAGLGSAEKPIPPPPTDADFVKLGQREPDWDLDPADPALDYAERYVQSTSRYGLERRCVHAQPSRVEGGRTLVDTRDSSENGCKGTGAVRDTFAVDVAHDHLELADPARGAPLADWPDGSSPGGMPTPSPKEGPPMDKWTSPLPAAFKALEFVPLRVQFYGRGSYPLISVATWHGLLSASPEVLEKDARAICKASAGFPIGVIATMDRATVLRIKCPAMTRWEHL